MAIPAPKDQWYVVHVLSGQEQKVRNNIARRIPLEDMSDHVFEVLVPKERISEVKKGKKSESERKFFPGYIVINMHLLEADNELVDKCWYFIRDTYGVIGFAGTKLKPIPMRAKEVDSMLAQIKERQDNVAPKIAFDIGETVKVSDGPFEGQTGQIEEINQAKGELVVAVDIFGRRTPVPLEYWQVERAE